MRQRKLKKLCKFCKNDNFYFECLERFESHDEFFSFKCNFVSFCKSFVPDFDNLHYPLTLNDTSNESILICDSYKTLGNDINLPNEVYCKNDNKFLEKSNIQEHLNEDGNEATILNYRLKGKFVSKNIVNLSKRKLSKPKSTFSPRNKDAVIEIYLCSLEEKLMSIEFPKDKYNNLTQEERRALFDLKNDKTTVNKEADNGLAVVV